MGVAPKAGCGGLPNIPLPGAAAPPPKIDEVVEDGELPNRLPPPNGFWSCDTLLAKGFALLSCPNAEFMGLVLVVVLGAPTLKLLKLNGPPSAPCAAFPKPNAGFENPNFDSELGILAAAAEKLNVELGCANPVDGVVEFPNIEVLDPNTEADGEAKMFVVVAAGAPKAGVLPNAGLSNTEPLFWGANTLVVVVATSPNIGDEATVVVA